MVHAKCFGPSHGQQKLLAGVSTSDGASSLAHGYTSGNRYGVGCGFCICEYLIAHAVSRIWPVEVSLRWWGICIIDLHGSGSFGYTTPSRHCFRISAPIGTSVALFLLHWAFFDNRTYFGPEFCRRFHSFIYAAGPDCVFCRSASPSVEGQVGYTFLS